MISHGEGYSSKTRWDLTGWLYVTTGHSTRPRTYMATVKQIEANRLNALKHGIFAEAPTVIGEDPAAFEALRDPYLARWEPATAEEETLVANLITHALFLRRFPKFEATPRPFAAMAAPTHTTRQDLELHIKLEAACKAA